MIKKTILAFAALLMAVFSFAGCEKNNTIEGIWPEIQVTVNGQLVKDHKYEVSVMGGVYKISSKNYGSLWLYEIRENGTIVWPEGGIWTTYPDIDLVGDWYKVVCDEEENFVVTIAQLPDGVNSRTLEFSLEFGDAFSQVKFYQVR